MVSLHFARSFFAAAACIVCLTTTAQAQIATCGQPIALGDSPTAADALYILRTAVGLETCNRCVCDVNDSGQITATDAQLDLQSAVGILTVDDCPACDPTGAECPGVVQFALLGKIRGACAANADCPAFSVCDPSVGRCRTATDSDIGWTGLAHNADINDPVPARLFLDCTGPAPCGQCTITGHDPSLGNCRCAADNRQVCTTVAGPDEQFCGGGKCECYFGPPMPLSSGNTPTCILNALSRQPSGEVNVDKGSGVIGLPLSEKIFLGLSLLQPCPLCVGDSTPADGVRDGTCAGGINDTQSCDAQDYNATFPPPTGALYSLDCFPPPGANISAGGLPLQINLTTGHTELAATLPCANDGPGSALLCPCRLCSGNTLVACQSDKECADLGAGTCSGSGPGVNPLPNDCSNGVCESSNTIEGRCAEGPDDLYCDAIVRPDGRGLIGCGANADCEAQNIGVNAGACTLVERRPCFLDPIIAQGRAHPVVPLASGTYCSPASSALSVNSVAGLPGPGRLTLQTVVSLECKNDPGTPYVPGSGGCPTPE